MDTRCESRYRACSYGSCTMNGPRCMNTSVVPGIAVLVVGATLAAAVLHLQGTASALRP